MLTEFGDLLAHTSGSTCTHCVTGQNSSHPPNTPAHVFRPSDRTNGTPSPAVVLALRSLLGAELRALRSESGLSQWQLSVRAGTARSTVERLEAGARRPTASMLASFVLAASWSAPPMSHVQQVAWMHRLAAAAGEHLVVDTPSGIRRRARRLTDARRAWKWRQARQAREAAAAEAARRQQFMADVRGLARAQSVSEIMRAVARLDRWS